jgi:regulator of replication initiation timing
VSELARDELGVTAAARAANVVRDQVVRTLAAYVELSARMRGLEEAFRTQVMGTGYQLQQLIEERRRLEAELERIRMRLDAGEYADDATLAADIEAALVFDDDGAELSSGQATERLASYRAAARRLDERLAQLRADATEAELTVPDDVQHRFRERNQEFLQAIDEESATVMRLRTDLENLRRKGDRP